MDQCFAIDAMRQGSRLKLTRIASQSHGAAEVVYTEQVSKFVDNLVKGVLTALG